MPYTSSFLQIMDMSSAELSPGFTTDKKYFLLHKISDEFHGKFMNFSVFDPPTCNNFIKVGILIWYIL